MRPPCDGPMLRYLSALSSGTTGRPCTWSGGAGCATDDGGCCAGAWAAIRVAGTTRALARTSAEGARRTRWDVSMDTEDTFGCAVSTSVPGGPSILDRRPETAHTPHVI